MGWFLGGEGRREGQGRSRVGRVVRGFAGAFRFSGCIQVQVGAGARGPGDGGSWEGMVRGLVGWRFSAPRLRRSALRRARGLAGGWG